MRILILVDTANSWSAHNRAKAIAALATQHEIVIRGYSRSHSELSDGDTFDVIHVNFSGGSTEYYDWIVPRRKKVLMTAINERSWFNGAHVDIAKYKALLTSGRTVALSRRMAEACGAVYIPNGIDTRKFSKSKPVVVGYAGTTAPNKNVGALVAACRELNVELRTALYNSKRHRPGRSHEEMSDFYCGLSVYVHPSLTEGFNNTIIEALSCNLPVLMTREGAWEEFVGYVEFIEPTTESIVAALRKFCGRKLIEEKFLWEQLVPKYLEQYEAVFNDNQS